MMQVRTRCAWAAGAVILSLPALIVTLYVPVIVFLFARLAGSNESPLGSLLVLARASAHSWRAAGVVAALAAGFLYWVLFASIVIAFVRGRAINRMAQAYCLAIVLLATAERIHDQVQVGRLDIWFGQFSLMNAVSLFALLIIGKAWLNAKREHIGAAA